MTCGKFNTGVEGNLLVAANELKNAGESRYADFDALKSVITDDTMIVNQKNNLPKRVAQNVANFLFITNNSYPISVSNCDRKYLFLCCNGKYAGDWRHVKSQFQGEHEPPDFYNDLMNLFT
jgi:hypothetical protein